MRAAVIGHVEWGEFVRVERLPKPGEIAHAVDAWEEVAGGGAVAAVQMAKLAGESVFFTALGDDELGHRAAEELRAKGVRVEAAFRPEPQRRAIVFTDGDGERTITTVGHRLGPSGDDPLAWDLLDETGGVYFCAGDAAALRQGRRARALVATSRVLRELARAAVPLDGVVGSAQDRAEHYRPGDLDPPPGLAVWTEGSRGGSYEVAGSPSRRFEPAPPPGAAVDAYGCGDSFAAGLAFGLGEGMSPADAIELAARCGAACLTGRGPFAGQFRLAGS